MKKQNEDFAIIHNTPKGQLLITREPDGDDEIITLWINLEIGMAKLALKIGNEEIADKAFEIYKSYEVANQEYL